MQSQIATIQRCATKYHLAHSSAINANSDSRELKMENAFLPMHANCLKERKKIRCAYVNFLLYGSKKFQLDINAWHQLAIILSMDVFPIMLLMNANCAP
jgi:hypothetical protein